MSLKFITLLLVSSLLFLQSAQAGPDEEELSVTPVIELDSAIQATLGLKTQTVRAVTQLVYRSTYGKVLDLTPLLDFRRDCLDIQVQLQQARKQFKLSQQALNRLEKMFRNKAASLRKLEQQRRLWLTDKTRLQQLRLRNMTLQAKNRQRWGELADLFCQADLATKFLSGEEKILAIVKPTEKTASAIRQLQLTFKQMKQAVSVQALDITELFDPIKQSTYLLYKTTSPLLYPGQHFSVSLPLADARNGLFIPGQSVLWHLGQAFVYIRIDEEHFQHRTIGQLLPVDNGYLVNDVVKPGEEIVVTGAQQLLSTEFRAQIADEDDD